MKKIKCLHDCDFEWRFKEHISMILAEFYFRCSNCKKSYGVGAFFSNGILVNLKLFTDFKKVGEWKDKFKNADFSFYKTNKEELNANRTKPE